MARRRTRGIQDFLTLMSKIQWPLGIGLAVVSFIVLNQIAQAEPVQSVGTSNIPQALFSRVGITLAGIGQYLLPALFLGAALGSFLQRRKSAHIFAKAAAEPVHGVADLSWHKFEQLIGEVFRKRGFSVRNNSAAGPDGGVDVELRRDGEMHLVQCKHWRSRKVPVATVRELYGVMTARQAAGGFIVTSGTYTSDATEFASGRNIELIDGTELASMLGQKLSASSAPPIESKIQANASIAPDCPICGKAMIGRIAKRGPQSGKRFWGCSGFPACRGTRGISE